MAVCVLIPLAVLDDLLSGIVSRVRPKDKGIYVRGARIVDGCLELSWVESEGKKRLPKLVSPDKENKVKIRQD